MIFVFILLGLMTITLTIMGIATLFNFKEMIHANTNRIPVYSDDSPSTR